MPSKYHTCAKEGCKVKTSHELCRYHVQVYNTCQHEGCWRPVRKEYCKDHSQKAMAYHRVYMRRIRGSALPLDIAV